MEEIKKSMDNIVLDEKTEECVCDLVNNNKDLINQMKAKIEELENMIKHSCYCYCGRRFLNCDENKKAD